MFLEDINLDIDCGVDFLFFSGLIPFNFSQLYFSLTVNNKHLTFNIK